MKIMTKLIVLVKPLAGVMILAVLLGALGSAAATAIPVLGGFALLHVHEGGAEIGTILMAAVICGILRGVFRYGEQTCNHFIAFKLLALIRERVFAALRRLCPAKLEGKERGNLITLVTGDIELLEVFYAHTISPVIIAVLVSLGATVFVGMYHPLFAVVSVAGYLTVGVVLPTLTARSVRRGSERLRAEAGRFSSFYLDSLRGLSELLQFGRTEERRVELGRRTEETEQVRAALNKREGIAGALSGFAVVAFSFVVLTVGFFLHRNGAVEFDGVLLPFITLFSSFGPVLALANLSASLPATIASGERVLTLLDERPETEEIVHGVTPEFTGAESRELSFAYGRDEILRGLSVEIPKGKITGITGKSGSGKSTFLKLLMRFWSAPSYTLFLSGTEIGDITTAHLRHTIGFVTQETDLFHDTIGNNIRLGRPDATDDEVIVAAKKASLHDFVMSLPKGYDTQVGELGSTLSGGERQRVGLARAFLYDAPLLLLDEPTSNLDSLNEGVILKALREESVGRTVVLVSHRRSTMGAAERMYSVENGRVS